MQTLIHTSLSTQEVAAFVCRLRLQGYKTIQLQEGWSSEVDGLQVFRATNQGNERYSVRYDERIFPDV